MADSNASHLLEKAGEIPQGKRAGSLRSTVTLVFYTLSLTLLFYLLCINFSIWVFRREVSNKLQSQSPVTYKVVADMLQVFVNENRAQTLDKLDWKEVDTQIRLKTYGEGIKIISVYDPSLRLLYRSHENYSGTDATDRMNLQQALEGISSHTLAEITPSDFAYQQYFSPIYSIEGKPIGAVQVHFDITVEISELRRIRGVILRARRIAYLVIVLCSLLFFVYMWRRMERNRMIAQQAEIRLKAYQSLARTGIFIAGLAHQLRNPLSILLGAVRSLEKRSISPEQAPYIEALRQESERMAHTVEAFLNFSKPLDIHTETQHRSDIVRQVRSVAEKLKSQMPQVRVEVSAPSEMFVGLSESLLFEILMILGTNSLEALTGIEDPRIDIKVSTRDEKALLSFADNGPGFSRRIQDQNELAFQPFFSEKARGLGLGLALVKRVIDEIDGTVKLNRSALGGALVEITFPII